jgi:hypothetical protein
MIMGQSQEAVFQARGNNKNDLGWKLFGDRSIYTDIRQVLSISKPAGSA